MLGFFFFSRKSSVLSCISELSKHQLVCPFPFLDVLFLILVYCLPLLNLRMPRKARVIQLKAEDCNPLSQAANLEWQPLQGFRTMLYI